MGGFPGILCFDRMPVPRIWGGRRLWRRLRLPGGPGGDLEGRSPIAGTAAPPIGESWEIHDREGRSSILRSAFGLEAELPGLDLRSLVEGASEALLGESPPDAFGRFPLMLKFLDTGEDLSLQLHPDHETARGLGAADAGKHESWCVLSCEPGAELHLGLAPGVGVEDFFALLEEGGDPRDLMNRYEPRPGEVYDLPPGCLHCLGAGLTLYECQENSDLTYRLHDWGRLGLDGRPRELHLEAARAAIRPRARGGRVAGPETEGVLLEHEAFRLERLFLEGPASVESEDRFGLLTLLEGEAVLRAGRQRGRLRAFETAVLSASAGSVEIRPEGGPATLLLTRPPAKD